jgi:hypothetical protein
VAGANFLRHCADAFGRGNVRVVEGDIFACWYDCCWLVLGTHFR